MKLRQVVERLRELCEEDAAAAEQEMLLALAVGRFSPVTLIETSTLMAPTKPGTLAAEGKKVILLYPHPRDVAVPVGPAHPEGAVSGEGWRGMIDGVLDGLSSLAGKGED